MRIDHVTFIRPNIILPKSLLTSVRPVPPLGLALLAAYVRAEGYRVSLVDAVGEDARRYEFYPEIGRVVNGLSVDELVTRIPADTDVVGISCMHSHHWPYEREMIKKVAARFPKVPIVLGGEHATAKGHEIMNSVPEIAACVRGEGEASFVELLMRLREGSGFGTPVAGVLLRGEDGKILDGGRRGRMATLDQLPFPAWDLFPIEKYFEIGSGIGSVQKRSLPSYAGRGCYHSCTFCTNRQMWNSEQFARSPGRVIEELSYLVTHYNVDHVDFLDLNFLSSKEWAREFAHLMVERELPLKWSLPIGTRIDFLDRDTIPELRRAGLQVIRLSAESGGRKTIALINKGVVLSRFEEVVKLCKAQGIRLRLAVIFGFPGQSWKEMFLNFIFAAKYALLGAEDFVSLGYVPYPGTILSEKIYRSGGLTEDFARFPMNNDLKTIRSYTPGVPDFVIPTAVVTSMGLFILLQYLVRPWRLISFFLHVVAERKPLTVLETIVFNFLAVIFRKRNME